MGNERTDRARRGVRACSAKKKKRTNRWRNSSHLDLSGSFFFFLASGSSEDSPKWRAMMVAVTIVPGSEQRTVLPTCAGRDTGMRVNGRGGQLCHPKYLVCAEQNRRYGQQSRKTSLDRKPGTSVPLRVFAFSKSYRMNPMGTSQEHNVYIACLVTWRVAQSAARPPLNLSVLQSGRRKL